MVPIAGPVGPGQAIVLSPTGLEGTLSDEEISAFTVEGPGEARDYYLASYDAERLWKTEEVEFQGEIGIVLTDEFRPTDALMVRGKLLSVGGSTALKRT